MNGAHSLLETLVAANVEVCFMNPGTSEMHFVAALDAVPRMRAILGLFEGVASGAADGYARMTGRPAANLLHLGPGLSNALANVHNARRAHSPMLLVVGDHATYHKRFDAPLDSDIEGLARPLSHWVRTSQRTDSLARDAAEAVQAALSPPGKVATLILPADVSWGPAERAAQPLAPPLPAAVDSARVTAIARVLQSGEPAVLLMNGSALREPALLAAERVANKTGARLFSDTFVGRLARGAGRPMIARLRYYAELAQQDLEGTRHLILVGTKPPATFFAYPDKPSSLVPEGCSVHTLAAPEEDCLNALEHLAEALDATKSGTRLYQLQRAPKPHGALDPRSIAAAVSALLPEHAIFVDEGNTDGFPTSGATATSAPHDWLLNTGGSIGLGLPLAIGAAVACPDRRVLCLEGDGSAMYTLSGLWTMAREQLNITTLILANRSYRILNIEIGRVGVTQAGPRALDMLDISRPELDFVALARGMGVPAAAVTSAEALCEQLERGFHEPGPRLIECKL